MPARYVISISDELMDRGAGMILEQLGIRVVSRIDSEPEPWGSTKWLVEDELADESYEGKRVHLVMAVQDGKPIITKKEVL